MTAVIGYTVDSKSLREPENLTESDHFSPTAKETASVIDQIQRKIWLRKSFVR
jgi:hypothetical protein